MAAQLEIQISEEAFSSLAAAAAAVGKSPAEQAASIVECAYDSASRSALDADQANFEFERRFGSLDMGRPVGVDNAAIDADLGRQYGSACGA